MAVTGQIVRQGRAVPHSSIFNDVIEQKQIVQQDAEKAQHQLQAINRRNGKLPTYLGQGSVFNIPLSGSLN